MPFVFELHYMAIVLTATRFADDRANGPQYRRVAQADDGYEKCSTFLGNADDIVAFTFHRRNRVVTIRRLRRCDAAR